MEKTDRVERPLIRTGPAAGSRGAAIKTVRSAKPERTCPGTRTSRQTLASGTRPVATQTERMTFDKARDQGKDSRDPPRASFPQFEGKFFP
jgi:hypothetical protein